MVFHPGTTAIVGPNGSGKSNIGEAIMWTLGEHNPHNLRCLSAAELVYNGNGLLRPQNYAEVNLVVDNEEGWLPLGFREVQITRRVDRSGEGECFINKARCRLRDVQELFLATGLGHRGYWVVSQNQVESVLSVRAEARRELIEEAAGTSRYRFRRQEVVRKLEATDRNLARVRDVLAELQAQLAPLAEEAENARRYKEVSSRLRELETACLLDETRTLLGQLQQLEVGQAALREKLVLVKQEREKAAQERQALESHEQELEPALDGLRQQVAEVAGRRQWLQAETMVAQSELRQVLRHRQEAKEEAKRLLASLAEARARTQQMEAALEGERNRLESLRQARGEKEEQLSRAKEAVRAEAWERIQEGLEVACAQVKDLQGQVGKLSVIIEAGVKEEAARIGRELATHLSLLCEGLSSLAGSRQRREEAEALRERLALGLADLGGEARALEERTGAQQAALETAKREAISLERTEEQKRAAAAELQRTAEQAEEKVKEQTKSLEQAENDWAGLQAKLAELSQRRSTISQRAFLVRDNERKAAAQEEELAGRLHQSELRRTRVESRLEAVQERLTQEFGPGQAVDEADSRCAPTGVGTGDASAPAGFDRAKAEKEVVWLRQELGRLGEVNLGSIYHHERLSARKAFLQEQVLDLEQGKESLQKAIQEIDRRTRSQFLSAFKKVGEEFQRLFQRLFGGGETELVLTDPTNLLETGVEITTCLPGKEMMNLLSLSGGERSLTAIAFLFSLLMVRPSPFCVLDEVDAALDEVNTRKFASLLKEMSGRSQFLIITHNPLTMESADYLYGVTVGDSGASKLLSVHLAERTSAQPAPT